MSKDLAKSAADALDHALADANALFLAETKPNFHLSGRMVGALTTLNAKAQAASAVFNNVVTCLAIKSGNPGVDVRYHQVQIQQETDRPAGVNFRTISEDTVYPWLDSQRFQGAKSGWQTRTLERPKPYTLDYAENIAHVRSEFLIVFDEIEERDASAHEALKFLIYNQIIRREESQITLAIPKTQDIAAIVELFRRHFFSTYAGTRGASRLPVLAIHAIYSQITVELKRYDGKSLLPLQLHSAADSQTGSLGDVEVADDASGEIFEAVEVKHGLPISESVVAGVREKVMNRQIERYYILTTAERCEPDTAAKAIIENIKSVYECQVIANGVIPTLRYYLRLLDDPSAVFPAYASLLQTDRSIAHEHRVGWNAVAATPG